MLVGEIGIPRKEFLYDLKLCDIILITRGYFRRYHPAWEQARLIAYNAAHAMGCRHTPPPPSQWLPFPWENEPSDAISEEEVEKIRNTIRQENNKKEQEQ